MEHFISKIFSDCIPFIVESECEDYDARTLNRI